MPLNARPKPPDPTIARDRLVDFFERDWIVNAFTRLSGNLTDLSRETGVARRTSSESSAPGASRSASADHPMK